MCFFVLRNVFCEVFFQTLAHFHIVNFKTSLCVLDNGPLSDVSFEIFSPSLILWTLSFAEQKGIVTFQVQKVHL